METYIIKLGDTYISSQDVIITTEEDITYGLGDKLYIKYKVRYEKIVSVHIIGIDTR